MNQQAHAERSASAPSAAGRAVRWVQHLFVRLGVLPFLLVLALVVFTALSKNFLTTDNLINVVRQSVYLTIVALGQMLALLTGGFDLSVGTIVALTSVVGATAMAAVAAASPDSLCARNCAGLPGGHCRRHAGGRDQRHWRRGIQRLAFHDDAGYRFSGVRHRAVHDGRHACVRDAASIRPSVRVRAACGHSCARVRRGHHHRAHLGAGEPHRAGPVLLRCRRQHQGRPLCRGSAPGARCSSPIRCAGF